MKKIVELTPEQWNTVLVGLGELPLKHSGPVWTEIQQQLAEKPEPKPKPRAVAD